MNQTFIIFYHIKQKLKLISGRDVFIWQKSNYLLQTISADRRRAVTFCL